jgi:hypothetical protein
MLLPPATRLTVQKSGCHHSNALAAIRLPPSCPGALGPFAKGVIRLPPPAPKAAASRLFRSGKVGVEVSQGYHRVSEGRRDAAGMTPKLLGVTIGRGTIRPRNQLKLAWIDLARLYELATKATLELCYPFLHVAPMCPGTSRGLGRPPITITPHAEWSASAYPQPVVQSRPSCLVRPSPDWRKGEIADGHVLSSGVRGWARHLHLRLRRLRFRRRWDFAYAADWVVVSSLGASAVESVRSRDGVAG